MTVGGGASPDIVHLMVLKKAMTAEQTKSAQLLEGLTQASPPPAPAAAPRTWYL